MKCTREDLAINGGASVRQAPLPVRRVFDQDDKQAAVALFDQAIEEGHHVLGYNGPQEEAYCREFADFLGGGYADAVNSGTTAVFVALRALEIPPYSEVIVPAVTDPGGMMPIVMANCIPVVADVSVDSFNVGPDEIEARITAHTRAIIVAHISGLPADMDPIMEIARARDIPVIEDCAQAHGAVYKGRMAGTLGDVASFSMMFGKHHATAGQGGMVFTRNEDLYWSARRHADRGKPFGIEAPDGNVLASLNFNMDELHAAIGRVQLRKLPQNLTQRRRIARRIARGCQERLRTVRIVDASAGSESAYWFLFADLNVDRIAVDKTTFAKAVNAEMPVVGSSYFCQPSRMPWFRDRRVFGADTGLPWSSPMYKGDATVEFTFPNGEAVDARLFRIDIHQHWTEQEVADLLDALEKVESAFLK